MTGNRSPSASQTVDDDWRHAARELAAYLPATLAHQIVAEGLPPPAVPQRFQAGVLLADISGFTPLSEELATDGPRGAEELSRVLHQLFEPMLDIIDRCGGTVSHYYGDAMVVFFPAQTGAEKEVARTTLACAGHLQQLMLDRFQHVRTTRPPGKISTFPLQMKVGASFGQCVSFIVGERALGLEFVLAGSAVDEAAAAEKSAAKGQVVATKTLFRLAGLSSGASGPHRIVDEALPLPEPRQLFNMESIPAGRLRRLLADAAPFVPPVLFQRILTAGAAAPADHRPVTSLFVSFEGLDLTVDAAVPLLQEYFVRALRIVARFGEANGRVNRILTGDKGTQLHIMFGAPVAPDAPEQAVRCALALQQEKPHFISRQKIGVVCGRVFAGPVGSGRRQEYTVVGDTVNLSARLAGVCEAGDVLFDPATAGRVRHLLQVRPLPPVKLKGKARPVPVFRAEGEQRGRVRLEAFLRRRRQRPLVGRQPQLDLLTRILDRALAGESQAVALVGPAGSGKSQLAAEGVRHWLAGGGTGFSSACREDTATVPYAPWLNVWREWFQLQPDSAPREQAALVEAETLRLWPEAGEDVGLWGEVLGLPMAQREELSRLDPAVRRDRFFILVRRCLAALAEKQPLLLLFEDLHHSDQASVDLLQDLKSQVAASRICLAATEVATPGQGGRLDAPTTIAVSEFTSSEARDYVRARFDASQVPQIIWEHLGLPEQDERGRLINPLFLEEMLREMLANEVVVTNGRLRVDEKRLASLLIPDNIQGLFLARLDRLAPAVRDLLLVATVIGEEFDEGMLAGMLAWPEERVRERLRQLERAGIARPIAAEPTAVYFFQHALLREAAYNSLNFAQRQTLHANAGLYLENRFQDNLRPHIATLAYHFGQTELHAKGAHFAMLAADDAKSIFANREAVTFYNVAERHLAHLSAEYPWHALADLRLSRSVAHMLLGDFAQASVDVGDALALARQKGDVVRAAQAYNWQAEYSFLQTRYDDVLSITRYVTEELADQIPPSEVAKAYQWAGMAYNNRRLADDIPKALDCLTRAEEIARENADDARLGRIYFALAQYFFMQDELNESLLAMQAGIRLADSFSTSVNITIAHNNIAQVLIRLGRRDEALAALDQAKSMAAESSRYLYNRIIANKGAVLAQLGYYAEAEELLSEAADFMAAEDNAYGLVEVHLTRAEDIYLAREEYDAAARELTSAAALIDRRPDGYPEELLRLWLGQGIVALAEDRLADAAALLAKAEAQVTKAQLPWWGGAVCYQLGNLHRATGNTERARKEWAAALKAMEFGANPDQRSLVLLALAETMEDEEARERALADALLVAEERARETDRSFVIRRAAPTLARSMLPERQRLAERSLAAGSWQPSKNPTGQVGS